MLVKMKCNISAFNIVEALFPLKVIDPVAIEILNKTSQLKRIQFSEELNQDWEVFNNEIEIIFSLRPKSVIRHRKETPVDVVVLRYLANAFLILFYEKVLKDKIFKYPKTISLLYSMSELLDLYFTPKLNEEAFGNYRSHIIAFIVLTKAMNHHTKKLIKNEIPSPKSLFKPMASIKNYPRLNDTVFLVHVLNNQIITQLKYNFDDDKLHRKLIKILKSSNNLGDFIVEALLLETKE